MSSSDSIVKSVAKELKYYCDVKRLEDGFDLSGVNSYRVDPSVMMQNSGPREAQVKRKMKRHMTNYHFLLTDPALPLLSKRNKSAKSKHKKTPKIPEYFYIYSARPHLIPRSTTSIGSSSIRSGKRRSKSSWSQSRKQTHDPTTRKEADRLVNAAAKLLVATETVESLDSARSPRPQTAPRSFEENRRPHTAKYSYDINGRKIFNTQLTYYDDSDSVVRKPRRSQSARSPIERPGSPTPSDATTRTDDTRSSSISVDDVQRLKTPAPPRTRSAKKYKNRTYISDNKKHDEEEVTVSKTVQTQGIGTDIDSVGIQTERRLLENYDHTEDEVKEGPMAEYQLTVQTGNTIGASTQADAKITLYGESGRSKEFTLTESQNHKMKFQKGKEDFFTISAHHVGKLTKIKIGHDRPELSYAWFLDSVTVSDMHDKRVYDLPCGRWLSGQYADKNTYLFLPVQRERAIVESSIQTPYESTVPRERRTPTPVSKAPPKLDKKQSRKREKQKDGKSESETDSSEYTTSVESNGKGNKKSPKKQNGRKSESSYTSDSDASYTDTETEYDSDTQSEKVFSLKDSPRAKNKNSENLRKISNDSSNKANGPTFTFQSIQGETASTERLNGEIIHGSNDNRVKSSKDDKKNDKENRKKGKESRRKNSENDENGYDSKKDYLSGYRAGLEAAQKERLKKRDEEMDEEKKVLTKGMTIHEAAWNGHLERIKQLDEHFPDLKESTDENGMVPLHKAVINGQKGVTKWLASSGVELDVETPTSYTPMHLAALHGHVNIMMILHAMGASVTGETAEKQTPLHLAARGGHLECVKWLVANRAVLTAEDTFGRKPVYLAEEFEQHTVADFLRACEKELENPQSSFAQIYGKNLAGDLPPGDSSRWNDDKSIDMSQKAEVGSEDEETVKSTTNTSTSSINPYHEKDIQERRKSYDDQHNKMSQRGKSFLDTIRQDIEEDEDDK
ncbi:uncharacterized protein LOC126810583 isoform X2 [Patella vulgata]|uniref:uncharacterized protein LOC126810583 isoform X2 n=1 Tax=Patella vulgata TaxID=6465 RepID=UPI00217FA23A|nr:uncharacterized protein LOC126810583 isoform X2 [Patella vulgata]